jgi:hypothetical protein
MSPFSDREKTKVMVRRGERDNRPDISSQHVCVKSTRVQSTSGVNAAVTMAVMCVVLVTVPRVGAG